MDWTWLQQQFQSVSMETPVYGNSVLKWSMAGVVLLVALIVLRLLKAILVSRLETLSKRTTTDWDDAVVEMLKTTRGWSFLVFSIFLASLTLTLPEKTVLVIQAITIIVSLIQAAIWGTVLVDFAVNRQVKKRLATDAAGVTTMSAVGFVGKLVLYTVILLLILDNMGVDVTALVAGLGVGGIAVALAAQNILGDLFASLSIVLDKPFVLGDFIIVDDLMGTVEKIGLKTTRIRSLSGEQLVFSNNDLLQSRIRNYKRMQERRVVFSIGVTYQTPPDKLAMLPTALRTAVEKQQEVRFDRAHFKDFGASSLNFEVVYYVLSADYNRFMDTQQAINLFVFRQLEDEGIEFAYPTQTIFVNREQSTASVGN